jgi:hypothetical protein
LSREPSDVDGREGAQGGAGAVSPPPRNPSLLVAQGAEEASLTVIMEMLRGLNESISSQNAAATEDRKLLHEINTRVVQIESNQLQRRVEELAREVQVMRSERDQRRGMVAALEWISKFGPMLLSIVAIAVGVIAWTGKK